MLTGVSINMLSKVKHGAIRGTKQFSTKASVPPRRTLSPNERAALRASRKQQAAQSMEAQTSSASKSAGGSSSAGKSISSSAVTAGKKPMSTRVVYGLGVGVPTVLLAWGIADETSPPAKFARMIGATKQWDEFADQFARPIREKLLPDWPVSVCSRCDLDVFSLIQQRLFKNEYFIFKIILTNIHTITIGDFWSPLHT